MRQYIRHPSDIPIEFELADLVVHDHECLNNISAGGLSFHSKNPVEVDAIIHVRIPTIKPEFEVTGRVVWCREQDDHYEIGLVFLDRDEAYGVRMVEQVCHIEQYKQQVLKTEGRRLSSKQAAMEWIKKYAQSFPHIVGKE